MPILSSLIDIFNPTIPQKPKNILLSRTDKIGDLILTIPSILMVRKLYPKSTITLLVNSYNFAVVRNLDIVDEIIKIDEYNTTDLITKLRAKELDIFISFYTDSYIGKIASLSDATVRIAPLSKLHSYFRYNLTPHQNRSKSIKNEAEYNLDLVRILDKDKFDKLFQIEQKIIYDNDNIRYVKKFLKENKITNEFIIINVFGGGSSKNLTLESYKLLINKLKKHLTKTDIILISSPSESKYLDTFNDLKYIKKYINNNDLLNLVALIDMSSLFISSSTGSTHIAGNLRKKTVAIYPAKKTQSRTRWGLYGNDQNTLYIIPDINKMDNYKNKYFDNITDEKLDIFAKEILEFYNDKK